MSCCWRPAPTSTRAPSPSPTDVLLLLEVADTSLPYDRRTKLPLYGRASVVEAWLVDIDAGKVDLYREPNAGGYADVRSAGRDERFSPRAFPDLVVMRRDLLGFPP